MKLLFFVLVTSMLAPPALAFWGSKRGEPSEEQWRGYRQCMERVGTGVHRSRMEKAQCANDFGIPCKQVGLPSLAVNWGKPEACSW